MPQLDKVTFSHQIVVVLLLFVSLFVVIGWLGISNTFAQMVSREFLGADNLAEDTEPFDKAKSLFSIKSYLSSNRAARLSTGLLTHDAPEINVSDLSKNISLECGEIVKNSRAIILASTLLD